MQYQKHFTVEEAQQILEKIRPQVEKIPLLKSELDRLSYDPYQKRYTLATPDGIKPYPRAMEELAQIVIGLHDRGIIIKGLDEGLIDFPHFRTNGEEVFLCWKSGEPALKFWHTLKDGFAGRKPLSEI